MISVHWSGQEIAPVACHATLPWRPCHVPGSDRGAPIARPRSEGNPARNAAEVEARVDLLGASVSLRSQFRNRRHILFLTAPRARFISNDIGPGPKWQAVPFPLRSQPYPSPILAPEKKRPKQCSAALSRSSHATTQPRLAAVSATLRQWPDGLNPAPEPIDRLKHLSIRSVHRCTSGSDLLSQSGDRTREAQTRANHGVCPNNWLQTWPEFLSS
jgi:hypothetical protein